MVLLRNVHVCLFYFPVETKPWEDSSSGTPGKTTAIPVTTQKSSQTPPKMTTLLIKALMDPDVVT